MKKILTYILVVMVLWSVGERFYTRWNTMCAPSGQEAGNQICAHHLSVSDGTNLGEYSCDESGNFKYNKQYTWASCNAELSNFCQQVMIDEDANDKEVEKANEPHSHRVQGQGYGDGYVKFYEESVLLEQSHKNIGYAECLRRNKNNLSEECSEAVLYYEAVNMKLQGAKTDRLLELPYKILGPVWNVIGRVITNPLFYVAKEMRCH